MKEPRLFGAVIAGIALAAILLSPSTILLTHIPLTSKDLEKTTKYKSFHLIQRMGLISCRLITLQPRIRVG